MKQLRIPILALLTTALLWVSQPAPAATADSALSTTGWISHVLDRLFDGLPWDLPSATVRDESATCAPPLLIDGPTDSTAQGELGPERSSESGALIDPDG